MEKLTLHIAARGYLVDNYPLRIGWTRPGGWRISALDPKQKRIADWVKANRFDRQIFQSRAHALEAVSLALEIQAPIARPKDAPCIYLKAGHWRLANGLEARREAGKPRWLIYRDDTALHYTTTLWRAARMAADQGERLILIQQKA